MKTMNIDSDYELQKYLLEQKNKEFKINNHKWIIEERPEEELLVEYHKRQPDAYSCLGLTFYKEHKIWITKDLCKDEKIRTLKHELTHCYIWENGFNNVEDLKKLIDMLVDYAKQNNELLEEIE